VKSSITQALWKEITKKKTTGPGKNDLVGKKKKKKHQRKKKLALNPKKYE